MIVKPRRLRAGHLTAVTVLVFTSGCEVFCVDAVHWLFAGNLYPIGEGRAYRSRQPDAALLEHVIQDLGVRTVINLRGENTGDAWYDAEVAAVERLGAKLANVAMSANRPPSAETLLALHETLLSAEHPILIHCKGGADRTGAAAAIWRMAVAGDGREQALGELDCRYGHFEASTPAMDWLARVYQPDVAWIETDYDPNAYWTSADESARFEPDSPR